MWFLGKKGTLLWGNNHFWVMNDHLWGPSVHVDKSFTKIQARVRPPPPFRQCLYFGSFCSGNPSLSLGLSWPVLVNFVHSNYDIQSKLLNSVESVKFNWNCEIQLKLWKLVEIVKFSWNCELQLKLWNSVEIVKISWNCEN